MRKLLKRIGFLLVDSDIPSHECLKIFDLIDEIEKKLLKSIMIKKNKNENNFKRKRLL